jgi:hypothetical protein
MRPVAALSLRVWQALDAAFTKLRRIFWFDPPPS